MMKLNRKGFTLVEILMVIVLVAILAGIGISQFTDFSSDAKTNTLKANLAVLRTAIANQAGQIKLRCNATGFPTLLNLTNNDITAGAGAVCTTTEVATASDRKIVAGSIPKNPWGGSQSNTIAACDSLGTSCTDKTKECADSAARTASSDGWCYNAANGEIWANSSNSGSTEYTY